MVSLLMCAFVVCMYFSRVTRRVSVAAVMDRTGHGCVHVHCGLVNEAAIYDVSNHADQAQRHVVCSVIICICSLSIGVHCSYTAVDTCLVL